MENNVELSKRLSHWFSARRRMRDWSDQHALASEVDPRERIDYVKLRNQAYECEWRLLQTRSSLEDWGSALMQESDIDQEAAFDLQESGQDLNWFSEQHVSERTSLKNGVQAWWFVPFGMWVGFPSVSTGIDPAAFAAQRAYRVFADRVAPRIQEALDAERMAQAEAGCEPMTSSLECLGPFCAEKLAQSPLPLTAYEQWSMQTRQAFAFTPDPSVPVRAGCIGVRVRAANYKMLAVMRDVLAQLVNTHLADYEDEHLLFWAMQPRPSAAVRARHLAWELWATQIMTAPLSEGAIQRHLTFTVEQVKGVPKVLEGRFKDLDASGRFWPELNYQEGVLRIPLKRPQLLTDCLEPFLEHSTPHVSWFLSRKEVPGLEATEWRPPGPGN